MTLCALARIRFLMLILADLCVVNWSNSGSWGLVPHLQLVSLSRPT